MKSCRKCPRCKEIGNKFFCVDKEQVRAPREIRHYPNVPEWCKRKERVVTSKTNLIKAV